MVAPEAITQRERIVQKFKLLMLVASCIFCIEGCSIKQVVAVAISSDKSDMDVADLDLIDPILRKRLELEIVRPTSGINRSIFVLTIHAGIAQQRIS